MRRRRPTLYAIQTAPLAAALRSAPRHDPLAAINGPGPLAFRLRARCLIAVAAITPAVVALLATAVAAVPSGPTP